MTIRRAMHFGYTENVRVILRETFTGNGSDTQFQLTSSIGNAVFAIGEWEADNIETTLPAHATTTAKGTLYDGVNPLTRNQVTVSSISAAGLVTLDYPPQAENFYIWYWYDLSGDVLSDYYREEFVATMEGESGTLLGSSVTLDTSNFTRLLSSADTTAQLAFDTLDDPLYMTKGHYPTGMENRTDSTLAFDAGTRTFTIAPAVTSFSYFRDGKYVTKSSAQTVVIDDTTQQNYIYFNSSDVLTASTTYSWVSGNVLVAIVYWDATNNKGRLLDERHGFVMSGRTHQHLHETIGALYESGFAMSFDDTTFTVAAGEFHDEDINFSVSEQTTCIVLYRMSVGSPSTWTWNTADTKYYAEDGGSDIYYDNAGTPTPVGSNNYSAMWIFVTNDVDSPIYAVMGQRTDTTIANARINNTVEGLDLTGLPSPEMILLAKVILRNDATPYEEYEDFRASGITGRTSVVYGAANIASVIQTDVTNFNGILGATDTDVQAALDTIDDIFASDISIEGALSITNTGSTLVKLFNDGTGVQVGISDTYFGSLELYGHATGDKQGGRITLYTGADYDTTIDYFRIQAYEDDLYIGPSTDLDALKLDANKDLYLTDGDMFIQFAGGTSVELDATNAIVSVGIADSRAGVMRMYGSGTGSTTGGRFYIFAAADYDNLLDYYQFSVYEDDLHIGTGGDSDILMVDSNKDFYLTAGSIILPASEYANFGGTQGSAGYGVRDNAGTMEFKNSGESWVGIGGIGASGYVLQAYCDPFNPSDSTTYYVGALFGVVGSTSEGFRRIYIPKNGILSSVYGSVVVSGTLGSAHNSSVYVRLNGASDTLVSSTVAMTAAYNTFSGTSLGIAVSAGDYIELKIVTPAWTTNPTTVYIYADIYIQLSDPIGDITNPLELGTNDDDPGILYLYGGGAGEEGGVLRVYLGADDDATVEFFGIQVVEDDLLIGPSNDTDALKLDSNKDLHITAGTVSCYDLTDSYVPYHVSDAAGLANSPIYIASATNVTIGGPTASGSTLDVKQSAAASAIRTFAHSDGSLRAAFGELFSIYNGANFLVYSDGGSSLTAGVYTGGRIYSSYAIGLATAAPVARIEVEDGGWTESSLLVKITQDDANVYGLIIGNDSYSTTDTNGLRFHVDNSGNSYITYTAGQFTIGPSGDTDALKLDANKDLWLTDGAIYAQEAGTTTVLIDPSNAEVAIGTADTTRGFLRLHGKGASNIQGGTIYLHTAADHDTSIDYFTIQVNEDDLFIGTAGDTDALKFTGEKNFYITAGDFYLVDTTNAVQDGVVYKGSTRFLHNFNYGDNGTVVTAGYNVYLGYSSGNLTAGATAVTGVYESSYNVGVGTYTLQSLTLGYSLNAIGYGSLQAATTAHSTDSIGFAALYSFTTGNLCVALGTNAGRWYSDGSTPNTANTTSTYIGANTRAGSAGNSNETCIGYASIGQGSNTVMLGNSATSGLLCYDTTISSPSDERIKTNVAELDSKKLLDFVCDLRPVTFNKLHPADWPDEIKDPRFKDRIVEDEMDTDSAPGNKRKKLLKAEPKRDIDQNPHRLNGMIAQEVEAAMAKWGIDHYLVTTSPNNGMKSLRYGDFIPALIGAVKELKEELDSARQEIAAMRGRTQ